MASAAASAVPRSILRSAQRGLRSSTTTTSPSSRLFFRRPLSSTPARQASVFPNAPPMEPHKPRPQGAEGEVDVAVGELEGTDFRIEPMRRTGEDDGTMRARLVYQSRKRGTLESDLLLSTFADAYLPAMTRAQMAQYDRFLDENDWDIYYWATQEPPANSVTGSPSASTASTTSAAQAIPSIDTADTNSPAYAGGVEAAISEATPLATSSSSTPSSHSSTHASPEPLSTGGAPRTGDAGEGKEAAAAAAAASQEPYGVPTQAIPGEWAQTVGTFKPAYRPVPARWRDSEVLALLRQHVKTRAREKGGMAFMPALRQ